MRPIAPLLAFALITSSAVALEHPLFAQAFPLKSFAYQSRPVSCTGGDQLLPFDAAGNWKLQPGFAKPGSGEFPNGSFYLRLVSISHSIDGEAGSAAYAVVGHSGPNGDWVSPMITGNGHADISFPADAAPLFTPGEYFDLHATCKRGEHWASVAFWYVPAPMISDSAAPANRQ